MSNSTTKAINRIIDANINRAKEGLRVCEEIARFMLNSSYLSSQFKKIRHEIKESTANLREYLSARESLKDIGRDIYINELKRKGVEDIFYANMQRTKESIRVLEEFSKLKNVRQAVIFKKLRYRIYEIEKNTLKRISALSNHR